MVSWPGVTPVKKRTDSPVIIEDIYPTFLEMAGVKMTEEVDGESFVEVLRNPELDRSQRPLFWHYPNLYHLPPYSSVRLGDDKLIHWHESGKLELYDSQKKTSVRSKIWPKKCRKRFRDWRSSCPITCGRRRRIAWWITRRRSRCLIRMR